MQERLSTASNVDKCVALQNITVDDLIKCKAVYHASCMQAIIHESEKSRKTNANDQIDYDNGYLKILSTESQMILSITIGFYPDTTSYHL